MRYQIFQFMKKQKLLLIRKIRYFIVLLILKFKSFKLENSLIILGESRSGTTWLLEILAQAPNTVIHWEPINIRLGVLKGQYNFGRRAYIPEENTDVSYLMLFKDVLTMKRISPWSTRFCKVRKLFKARFVVTKFVKVCLLLPWLVNRFKFKYKPILLLRHPIATAYSQVKTFNKDKLDLKPFKIPQVINNERYEPHVDFINQLSTHLQRQVALWCLNTVPILKHPGHGKDWKVVYYEKILMSPNQELENLNKELGINIPIKSIAFQKASQMAVDQLYKPIPESQLKKWMDLIDSKELECIQKIFDYFDFDLYTIKDFFPNKASETFI